MTEEETKKDSEEGRTIRNFVSPNLGHLSTDFGPPLLSDLAPCQSRKRPCQRSNESAVFCIRPRHCRASWRFCSEEKQRRKHNREAASHMGQNTRAPIPLAGKMTFELRESAQADSHDELGQAQVSA